MKRIATLILSGLFAIILSSAAFAGMDYTRYQQDFSNQKGIQKSSGEKHFGHTSKYERQEINGTQAPARVNPTQSAGKYDRSNWAPQH